MVFSAKEEEEFSLEDTHTLLNEYSNPKSGSSCPRSLRSILWITFSTINIAVFAFNALHHFSPGKQKNVDAVRLKTHEFTKDAIKLELRPFQDTFGDDEHSIFRGNRRPGLDKAWKGMIHGYNIRVPPSIWLPDATSNNTLVEIPDGSGDRYAVLSVLHNLHCLKTLREYLQPEDYPDVYERFKPELGENIGVHIDHCIDILRQSAMCHADMTLLPLEWWESNPVPQNVINTPHLCANWELVQDWAVEHSFNPIGVVYNHDHNH